MIYPAIPRIRPPVKCSLRTKLQFTMQYQGNLLISMAIDIQKLESMKGRPGVLARLRARRNEKEVRRVAVQCERYYKELVK